MKKLKKAISITMSAIVITSLFVGCSSKKVSTPKEETKPVELIIWGGVPAEMGPDKVMENYNKLMGGKVTVKYNRYVVGEGDTALDMGLMSGEHIDGYLSHDFDKMAKRMSSGLAEDMSGLLKKSNMDLVTSFGQAAKPFQLADGKVFAIPTTKMGYFVYLNKDMLDAAKLPVPTQWTLDDMKEYAKKLTKGENENKIYGVMSHRNIFPLILAEPTLDYQFYYNKDFSQASWDKPAFRKSLEIVKSMTTEKLMPNYLDIISQKMEETSVFASGKAGMAVSLSYGMRNLKDTNKYPHTYVTAFAPLPVASKDQSTYYTNQLLNDYFSINPKSKYKNEMFDFYKWFATEGYEPLIAYGRIPLYQKYNKDNIVKQLVGDKQNLFDLDSLKKVLLEDSPNPQTIKTFKSEAIIFKAQKEEYEKFITGKETMDSMILNLDKSSNQALKETK